MEYHTRSQNSYLHIFKYYTRYQIFYLSANIIYIIERYGSHRLSPLVVLQYLPIISVFEYHRALKN